MAAPTVNVTCTANDQNGNPVAGALFVARLDRTEIYHGFVVPEQFTGVANADGVCVLQLWPNALGVASSQYRISAVNPDDGRRFLNSLATIPNNDCFLHEVMTLEPYPPINAAQQALVAAQNALAPVQEAAAEALGYRDDALNSMNTAVAAASSASVSADSAAASADLIDGFISDVAAPTGSALVGFQQPGGVVRTVESKLRESMSVKDFGAVGDGVTDDTAAFNALTARIRSLLQVGVGGDNLFNIDILIPPGTYSISSWDLTSLLGRSINIHGYGVSLLGRTAGKVVVDALGSRWLRFHGIKVIGATGTEPLTGIQIGPKGLETCGNNTFNDVECIGRFSRAAFHNSGSETTQHFGCTYLNRSEVAGAYAYIGDGITQFVPQSDYAVVTRVSGNAVSFTNNSHYGTQVRNEGGGDAVFLSQTSGWLFDATTYFLSFNGAAVRLYGTSSYRNSNLTLNGLYETDQLNVPVPGNTGIKYGIALDGDGSSTAIDGLTIHTAQPLVTVSMFHNVNASSYRLSNVSLKIQGFKNAVTWFSGGGTVSVHGVIETREAAKLNLDAVTSFSGIAHVNDFAAMGKPPSGGYQVFDQTAEATYIAGDQNGGQRIYLYNSVLFSDGSGTNSTGRLRAKGAGEWNIGNENNTNILAVQADAGSDKGVIVLAQPNFPRIRPNTSAADCDLQIEGKGTGLVRYGVRTASADAPITGYIEIKDAGGTVRRLAVIG